MKPQQEERSKKRITPTVQDRKVNVSARKARLVADLIRGLPVHRAYDILTYTPHKTSPIFQKLLLNGVNNYGQKEGQKPLTKEELYVKALYVDGGRMLKRIQPAPQGRAHRIRKRSAHISLFLAPLSTLAPKEKQTQKPPSTEGKVAPKSKKKTSTPKS